MLGLSTGRIIKLVKEPNDIVSHFNTKHSRTDTVLSIITVTALLAFTANCRKGTPEDT